MSDYKAPWPIYVVRGVLTLVWMLAVVYLTSFGFGAYLAGIVILLCGAFDMAIKSVVDEDRKKHESE